MFRRFKKSYKTWNISVFFRLSIAFVLILIPLFAFYIVSYNQSAEKLGNEIYKVGHAQVQSYVNELASELQRIERLQFLISQDADIMMLASVPEIKSDFERSKAINRIIEKLRIVGFSSSYIQDVTLYLPYVNRIISMGSGYYKMNENEYETVMSLCQGSEYNHIYNHNGNLTLWHPSSNLNSEFAFIITIEISNEEILESLDQFEYVEKGGVVLFSPSIQYIVGKGYYEEVKSDINIFINDHVTSGFPSIIELQGDRYGFIESQSRFSDMYAARYISEHELYRSLPDFKKWLFVFIMSALLIIIIFSAITYRIIKRPINKLVELFHQVEQGNLNEYIGVKPKDEFRYIYDQFNKMIKKIKYSIDQVYKQKIFAQKAELKQLQSQINPHFLYNSFFTLSIMAQNGENDLLEEFTHQLGEYFRFITKNSSEEVSLEQEIEHAKVYANIQAKRFSNRIQVLFEPLPDQFKSKMVPRLIIQPIIENAFIHGLEQRLSNGKLTLRYVANDQCLVIIIKDNGKVLEQSEIKSLKDKLNLDNTMNLETTGIINTDRRIKLKFGSESGIVPVINENSGLTMHVIIHFEGDKGYV